MPVPSLKDQGLFFTNILLDPGFRRDGYLFGQEAGIGRACHWVVIDPNRHAMRVWSKPTRDTNYLAAAKGLNATAFTNGPYWRSNATLGSAAKYYAQGYFREIQTTRDETNPYLRLLMGESLTGLAAVGTSALKLFVDLHPGSAPRGPLSAASWTRTAIECFGGPPCGVVVQQGVTVYSPTRMNPKEAKHGEYVNAYIARGEGTQFRDYSVGTYYPPAGMGEVMGGVSMAIWAWQDARLRPCHGSGTGSNQWVFWGLAELNPSVEFFDAAEHASLASALQGYQKANAAGGPVAGLIFGLCSHADAQLLRNMMLGIVIRDAVCLDTSDSALFGHHGKILWGDAMCKEKQDAQNFGIAFFPI